MRPYTVISTRGLDELAWRRLRQSGIGGSDAPHIVLTSDEFRYADPEKLLRDKIEPVADEPAPIPCRVGHALEPLVADLYTEMTGRRVHRIHAMLRSVTHPFLCANVDRKLCGVDEGLECKTIGWMGARRRCCEPEIDRARWIDIFASGEAEIDLSYKKEWYIQMQHYMAVTGWAMWHLAVLIDNNRFVYYDVPRDDALIEQLVAAEAGFWGAVCDARDEWKRRS